MDSAEKISARIEQQHSLTGVVDRLVGMPGSELQSLLMRVMHERSVRRTAADLVRQRNRDSSVAAVKSLTPILDMELRALRAAADFDSVVLSPLAPQGINTILGDIHQNRVAATIRGSEVVADPTTSLALEAAVRRTPAGGDVALSSAVRVMRLGPLPDSPAYLRHFSLFALVNAGRSRRDNGFELASLRMQVGAYLRMLRQFEGHGVDEVELRVSGRIAENPIGAGRLNEEVFAPLTAEYGALLTCTVDPSREHARAYYDSLLFKINVRGVDESWNEIGDGGTTGWTQRLLNNRKERLLVSGISMDRLVLLTHAAGTTT